MILIADSSALIALAIVDQLDVLEKLFGEVYVPRAVYDEISKTNKAESRKLSAYCNDKVVDIQSRADFNVSLGRGESEAIVLYAELEADFLLCDDKKAKKFARSFGLNVIGSLGILLKAKEAKLIDRLAPLIEILRGSRIFIDDKTCAMALRMAGEDS
jgi:predicted nucleic acid-binding protein